jgi:hypothetical protein
MNYTELQQAILDDTHKSQYVGANIQRFIAQGEALISANLESFNFIAQLTDANRTVVGGPIYNLPARLTHLRYVKVDGRPLDKVDETSVYLFKNATTPVYYVQRATQIEIAGVPALLKNIDIDYMGMPAPLAVTPTNTLLDEYPQLYMDAASVYVFRRAENEGKALECLESMRDLCNQLNRKSKKLLGGAQAAPAYNVRFRSSY